MGPSARRWLAFLGVALLASALGYRLYSLEHQLTDLRERLFIRQPEPPANPDYADVRPLLAPYAPLHWLSRYDIDVLKRKGLRHPVQDITGDLMRHPELIPYKGVLGGTMGFYARERIFIADNGWVLAYFEDGHRAGYMLLQYRVSPTGQITWKRLYSELKP